MIILKSLTWVTFIISVLLVSSVNAQGGLNIDGATAATNDRFTNDSNFILNGFDISAVGQGERFDGLRAFATVVAPNIIVSAYHARPDIGGTFEFFPGNDPTVAPVTRTVISEGRFTNQSAGVFSDLFVGVLDSNLPSSITPLNFTTQQFTGPTTDPGFIVSANPGIAGTEVFLFGLSEFGSGLTDQAVGRNVITGFAEDVDFEDGFSDSLFAELDAPGDPNFVANEAFLNAGDSGAPLLTIENGELLLLGINSFVVPEAESPDFFGSGFTFIGNQSTELQAFIDANVSTVPEPHSFFLLSLLGLSAMRRKRSA